MRHLFYFILILPNKRYESVLYAFLIIAIAFKSLHKDFFFVVDSDNYYSNIRYKAKK